MSVSFGQTDANQSFVMPQDPIELHSAGEETRGADTIYDPTPPMMYDPAPPMTYESTSTWNAGFKNGIFLNVRDQDQSYEVRMNLRTQFRFVSFSREVDSWTNSAGVTTPIEDRRNFDIERTRLVFSGHAFTPLLTYSSQFDSDTDSRHITSMVDGWFAWRFSDALQVQLGKRKVPGTRNWILGAFDTRMIDRPIANEFFRPSRTTGIWFIHEPAPDSRFEFMLGQGYNTDGLVPSELGENFAIGSSLYRDVVGNYGPSRPTDFEWHDDMAVRLGVSSVGSVEGTPGRQLEETDFLRLTDGTRITEPGALAPGATVNSFDVFLVAFDAAYKFRGWSANAEYFIRSISHLAANVPVPRVGLQHGFYCEGGSFLIPKCLESNAQYSFVTGDQGTANSYAAGFTYYPKRSQLLKIAVDTTYNDGSPANSTGADILVGEKGMLLRMQVQAQF